MNILFILRIIDLSFDHLFAIADEELTNSGMLDAAAKEVIAQGVAGLQHFTGNILDAHDVAILQTDDDAGTLLLNLIPIGVHECHLPQVEHRDIGRELGEKQGKIVEINTEPVAIGVLAIAVQQRTCYLHLA